MRPPVKAPRDLTHGRRPYAPKTWVQRITAGRPALGDKRAVLLVQLAPSHVRDDTRLAYVLEQVPGWLRLSAEFRHPSWHRQDVFALLEARRTAYCVMSGAHLPCALRATTDLVYVRMHGPDQHHLYAGPYSDTGLRWWAHRIHEWDAAGKDVFAYFNNDGNANAVRNARTLQTVLGQ